MADIPRGWRKWAERDILDYVAVHAGSSDAATSAVVDAMWEELDERDFEALTRIAELHIEPDVFAASYGY